MTEPTGTVADIADARLVERAVNCARRKTRRARKQPRWVYVQDTFALDATYSMQLCRRFNLDPDEKV